MIAYFVLAWEWSGADTGDTLLALITAGLLQILSNLTCICGDAVWGSDLAGQSNDP
ncbi:hypothetical protein [Klebsiella pneumoniae]|uniref:hypothetical protein n=1 Tax=Klebsiella pneumoniae TaxID=573 RepID=UPI0039873A67